MRFSVATTVLCFAAITLPATAQTSGPRIPPWGFDLAGRDLAVRPGDDFDRHASGTYYRDTRIPDDRISIGGFMTLIDQASDQVLALVQAQAAGTGEGDAALIGTLYRCFMDEARIEDLDDAPLQDDLDRVRAATTREAMARVMGESHGRPGGSFFLTEVTSDQKAPDRNALYAALGGLGLPDRDFYLLPAFEPVRAAYRTYLAQMLAAADWPEAKQAAEDILALETRIAGIHWPRAQRRQRELTYNPTDLEALAVEAPGFPWQAWADGAGIAHVPRLVVLEKSAFPAMAALFAETPLPTLQAWAAAQLIDQAAPYLSTRFVDRHFAFRGQTLSGLPRNQPRVRRAARLVDQFLGHPLGRLYVARHFPPSSKAAMERLVADLRTAMRARIARLDWMSEGTKAEALRKMRAFGVKIGYPDHWRDYSGLMFAEDDLYGNMIAAGRFERAWQLSRLDRPVDPGAWELTPQTVNAYYHPVRNEIVFPAAILQPPFFDPAADAAVNYGAIGGVIGHEITHGFDDQGRKSDGGGMLRDWWTPEDAAQFDARAKALAAQYSAIAPLHDAHVNGAQTLGENIADLGGVLLAIDAYHLHLAGQPAPVLDGLTGEQRLFYGWAQVWRSLTREAAVRQLLSTDTHSPNTVRAWAPLRNVDAWYESFDVQPGDANFVAPAQRVRIW